MNEKNVSNAWKQIKPKSLYKSFAVTYELIGKKKVNQLKKALIIAEKKQHAQWRREQSKRSSE